METQPKYHAAHESFRIQARMRGLPVKQLQAKFFEDWEALQNHLREALPDKEAFRQPTAEEKKAAEQFFAAAEKLYDVGDITSTQAVYLTSQDRVFAPYTKLMQEVKRKLTENKAHLSMESIGKESSRERGQLHNAMNSVSQRIANMEKIQHDLAESLETAIGHLEGRSPEQSL